MNGEMNGNNNIGNNGNTSNNRSSASNGGFNISNLFDLSRLGNMFGMGGNNGQNRNGNNPLNNLARMFNGGGMNNRNRGYRNVLGVIPIEDAYRKIKNGNVLLIDVRTEMEYKTVRIKGSINIPLDRLQEEIGAVTSNKSEYIMLYCATGSRVRRAAQILWSLGYNNLHIWEGAGINTFAFHDLIVYNSRQQDEGKSC